MKIRRSIRCLATAGLLVLPALTLADPIGPTCTNNSCNGGVYTLSYNGTALPDADPLHETYRITLDIDTSGVTGVVPTAVAIDAAAIKVSSSAPVAASLFSAPGGVGTWALHVLGLTATGCGGGSGGFTCADKAGGAAIGGILDWVFDITVNNGALFTALNTASIKARYIDSGGNKVGELMSENITLQNTSTSSSTSSSGGASGNVPEPSASGLALLGMGLLGATLWMRRRSDHV